MDPLPKTFPTPSRWTVWAWAALLILLVAGGAVWVTPPLHPAQLDGPSYLAGAESIATGHGYRMVHALGAPPITTYPPLHSALLSWVWRIQPDYPANLGLLHASMHGVGLLALLLVYFEWIRRGVPPWLAALTGLAFGWSAAWQSLLFSCMAEPLFLLLVGAMAWWHRQHPAGRSGMSEGRWWTVLGCLAAFMYLTRSAAAGIIAGILFAGIGTAQLRRWRNLAGFLLPLASAATWMALQPKSANAGYLAYLTGQWQELGGVSGAAKLAGLQAWEHLSGLSMLGVLSDALARMPHARRILALGLAPLAQSLQIFVALGITALAVRGYLVGRSRGDAGVLTVMGVYLLQLVLWPFPMGSRAAIFLIPWWVGWVWRGWLSLGWVARHPKIAVRLPATILTLIAATNLPLARMGVSPKFGQESADIATVGNWIRDNVPASEIVGFDRGVSGFDLYHAADRPLLFGPGGGSAPLYDPVPQDPGLRAQFMVVRTGSPLLQQTGWELRREQGNLRVLERRTPGN